MKMIKPRVKLLEDPETHYPYLIKKISDAGWTSTRFESDGMPIGERELFIERLIRKGHLSVLEHGSISVLIVADRGFLAEITRHRVGVAFTVESTRYCNYSDSRLFKQGGLEFIDPRFYCDELDNALVNRIFTLFKKVTDEYVTLTKFKQIPPEIARCVLPLALVTRIYMTANIREWRYIIQLRSTNNNHPLMRTIMGMILSEFKRVYPVFFGDLPDED